MALLPKGSLDCVVALGIVDSSEKDGSERRPAGTDFLWVASGFFYGEYLADLPDGRKAYATYLVTNRHVFQDLSGIFLRCNPQADKPARVFAYELLDKDDKPVWFPHPDPKIDVAIAPIDLENLKSQGMEVEIFENDEHVANVDKLNQLGITEGDFAYVLGFPMGIVGGERNAVIVRSGTVARITDMLARTSHEFLLDSFVFPGNSGGPVISKPDALAIEGTRSQNAAYLIGIVKSYLPYMDVAYSKQTNRPRVIFEQNSGLAAVHSVDCIQEAVKQHLRINPPKIGGKIEPNAQVKESVVPAA